MIGHMPEPGAIERTFAGLVPRRVEVKLLPAPLAPSPAVIAVYSTAGAAEAVLLVCDLAVAASIGAGLTLIPVSEVKACLASGKISPAIQENFSEVANVFAATLSATCERHHLEKLVYPPDLASPAVAERLKSSPDRASFAVSVQGYVAGNLTVVR